MTANPPIASLMIISDGRIHPPRSSRTFRIELDPSWIEWTAVLLSADAELEGATQLAPALDDLFSIKVATLNGLDIVVAAPASWGEPDRRAFADLLLEGRRLSWDDDYVSARDDGTTLVVKFLPPLRREEVEAAMRNRDAAERIATRLPLPAVWPSYNGSADGQAAREYMKWRGKVLKMRHGDVLRAEILPAAVRNVLSPSPGDQPIARARERQTVRLGRKGPDFTDPDTGRRMGTWITGPDGKKVEHRPAYVALRSQLFDNPIARALVWAEFLRYFLKEVRNEAERHVRAEARALPLQEAILNPDLAAIPEHRNAARDALERAQPLSPRQRAKSARKKHDPGPLPVTGL